MHWHGARGAAIEVGEAFAGFSRIVAVVGMILQCSMAFGASFALLLDSWRDKQPAAEQFSYPVGCPSVASGQATIEGSSILADRPRGTADRCTAEPSQGTHRRSLSDAPATLGALRGRWRFPVRRGAFSARAIWRRMPSLDPSSSASPAGPGRAPHAAETMPEHASDLFALLQTMTAGMDSQFEFWLTLTFALAVSTFLAAGVLTRGARVAIAILYVLSIYLVWLQHSFHVEQGRYLLSLLVDLGVEIPSATGELVDAVRTVIFLAGSLAALVFVLREGLARSDDRSAGSADE